MYGRPTLGGQLPYGRPTLGTTGPLPLQSGLQPSGAQGAMPLQQAYPQLKRPTLGSTGAQYPPRTLVSQAPTSALALPAPGVRQVAPMPAGMFLQPQAPPAGPTIYSSNSWTAGAPGQPRPGPIEGSALAASRGVAQGVVVPMGLGGMAPANFQQGPPQALFGGSGPPMGAAPSQGLSRPQANGPELGVPRETASPSKSCFTGKVRGS